MSCPAERNQMPRNQRTPRCKHSAGGGAVANVAELHPVSAIGSGETLTPVLPAREAIPTRIDFPGVGGFADFIGIQRYWNHGTGSGGIKLIEAGRD
jgi:hypothetical protein